MEYRLGPGPSLSTTISLVRYLSTPLTPPRTLTKGRGGAPLSHCCCPNATNALWRYFRPVTWEPASDWYVLWPLSFQTEVWQMHVCR